jgi:glutamate carboxypeptidase
MAQTLEWTRARQSRIVALIRQMVECESPSDSPEAVNRFVELIGDTLAGEARVKTFSGGKRYGRHLRAEFILPGKKKSGQILALGHSDTVWPMGTLKIMPFREADGRLWGPGVLDMKAGVAFFIFAMRALREMDVPVARKVILQLNSDEEVGSHSSRPLTEDAAKKSVAVLVLEPGTGLAGKLKTARKGVGDFTVKVRGVASHAGVDFSAGANAIVELARQIDRIAGFTDLSKGLTVSPGVIGGGTRSNVVPAEAEVVVDVRIARLRDEGVLAKNFLSLKPIDKRCKIEVTGGLNRPPMERSKGVVQLFQTASRLANEFGVVLEESATGGGSDGNFTAALGIPTLDGLGAVGEGAHAVNESLLTNRIADRTALMAKLVAAL